MPDWIIKSSHQREHHPHCSQRKNHIFIRICEKQMISQQLANSTLHLNRSGMLLAFTKTIKKSTNLTHIFTENPYERHDQSGSSSRSN